MLKSSKLIRQVLAPVKKSISDIIKRNLIRHKQIILPKGKISLSYAGMSPDLGTVVHGGRVKLAHLSEVYPECNNEFNILYLVSSSLPPFAEEWVQMARKNGVKIVWNQNGVAYPAWAGEKFLDINAPMRKLIHQADWVIYQSEFCRISSDYYLGEIKGLSSIVYNCVNSSAFIPVNKKPKESVKLLVMGSHHQASRVIVPLEVLSLLLKSNVQAHLRIAGRFEWPNAEEEVHSKINYLNLEKHVEIFGPYLQEQAPKLYGDAHLLLHLKYNDPCPTVPIEAMSCGVPVVGSGSGGVPELLGSDGGFSLEVPPSWDHYFTPNPEAIADAVKTIIKDWDWWSTRSRQRVVNYFSKEKWLAEHEKIFSQLVN